ncbi:MAG: HupE/UreJ family protein, partial [Phycisphaerae bacterium]
MGALHANAHDFLFTETRAHFHSNGMYQIDMVVDLDALALGEPASADNSKLLAQIQAMTPGERDVLAEHLRRLFTTRTTVKFDGVDVQPTVEFLGPDFRLPPIVASAAQIPADEPASQAKTVASESQPTASAPVSLPVAIPSYFGVVARLSGRVPPEAREFTFRASRAFQNVHLYLSREDTERVIHYILEISEESPPYQVLAPVIPPTRLQVAWRYTVLGFEHILPKGLDHILFVVGLFLLSNRMRPLLLQVSAFTIAHTVTLAL